MRAKLEKTVEDQILQLLMGNTPQREIETFRKQLQAGKLEEFKIDVEVPFQDPWALFFFGFETLTQFGEATSSFVYDRVICLSLENVVSTFKAAKY